MDQKKVYRLMCVFCWIGTAMVTGLEAYMLHLTSKFPGVETFARNTRLLGVLLLIWLAVSAYFTVKMRKGNKK